MHFFSAVALISKAGLVLLLGEFAVLLALSSKE